MDENQTPGTPPAEPHGTPAPALWVGVFLIGLGLLLFLGQFQIFHWYPAGRLWPALLILFGAARLASGSDRHRWGGFWMLLAGIYCGIGEWRLFGLGWNTAWPIFLIGAGVSLLLRGDRDRDSWRRERYARRMARYGR